MSYLVLNRLSQRYGDLTAVEDLSLSVERGEFISLLGPSGCGKTTTLQMIAGFVEPSGGSIVLDGKDVSRTPANKRGLGMVFQNYALFPHMTAAENVSFGLEMQRVGKDERQARVAEALKLVGLSHLADRHPARMSGGQQQRVALARALVIRPSVLLLDEPLSNLDAKLREEMQLELRSIQRTVGTFLGKANVFTPTPQSYDGEVRARIGEAHIAMDGQPVPQGAVIVRPEKILFAEAGACALPGRMKTRVFQGNHWLCQVETSVGEVMVIRQNDGVPVPAEGATVHLRWRAQDMCAVAGQEPAK